MCGLLLLTYAYNCLLNTIMCIGFLRARTVNQILRQMFYRFLLSLVTLQGMPQLKIHRRQTQYD